MILANAKREAKSIGLHQITNEQFTLRKQTDIVMEKCFTMLKINNSRIAGGRYNISCDRK